jgi:hypothetical protein
MTLALRRRHRWMFAALAVLLPVALVLGIAARRTVPDATALSPALSSWTQTFTATEYELGDLFPSAPVRVSLWREQDNGRFAVGFVASKDFVKPDLLAYWITGHPLIAGKLPPEATLLGAFIGGPLKLPVEAATAEGSLILFSLADQEVVDVSKPTRFSDTTK